MPLKMMMEDLPPAESEKAKAVREEGASPKRSAGTSMLWSAEVGD